VKRREFIGALVGGASAAWPLAARAQLAMPVIGFLNAASPATFGPYLAGFIRGLKDAGYTEGANVAIEYRWAEGNIPRLTEFANELVSRKVNVIAAAGGEPAALAAKSATSTIPTVFGIGGDPVKHGLVASFNRPDGNATGITLLTSDLEGKRIELLLQIAPQASTVTVLINPQNPNFESQLKDCQDAGRRFGRAIEVLKAATPAEIETALAGRGERRAHALAVCSDPFFNNRRKQIVDLVARNPVPAIYQWREFVEAGGLMSYGTNLAGMYREIGRYVGRVLNGEKPAALPVLQPTKFEIVINLKTAKAIGIEPSPMLLARADEVIE
jgi:putative ABC transport system substrate-binding protein